ncbi:MAG: hypothetical protein QQN41_11270 [Nitrosopumilus sp.]
MTKETKKLLCNTCKEVQKHAKTEQWNNWVCGICRTIRGTYK